MACAKVSFFALFFNPLSALSWSLEEPINIVVLNLISEDSLFSTSLPLRLLILVSKLSTLSSRSDKSDKSILPIECLLGLQCLEIKMPRNASQWEILLSKESRDPLTSPLSLSSSHNSFNVNWPRRKRRLLLSPRFANPLHRELSNVLTRSCTDLDRCLFVSTSENIRRALISWIKRLSSIMASNSKCETCWSFESRLKRRGRLPKL